MSGIVFAASFAALYAGHMVGDHVVQSDRQASLKAGKGWSAAAAMAGHVSGYALTQLVALVAIYPLATWSPVGFVLGLAFSAATHAFIDRRWPVLWILRRTGSANFAGLTSGGMNGPYLTDQALHVGCLFVAALIIGGMS